MELGPFNHKHFQHGLCQNPQKILLFPSSLWDFGNKILFFALDSVIIHLPPPEDPWNMANNGPNFLFLRIMANKGPHFLAIVYLGLEKRSLPYPSLKTDPAETTGITLNLEITNIIICWLKNKIRTTNKIWFHFLCKWYFLKLFS